MSYESKCKICNKDYMHGSALYDYYECGHAFEKPLNDKEKGCWISYSSPYIVKKEQASAPKATKDDSK